MDRLGLLNAFPQITQRDGHLEMEQLNHTELAVNHRMGKSARVQAAAYHDGLRNAAVWGLGPTSRTDTLSPGIPSPILPAMALSLMPGITNRRVSARSMLRLSVRA